MVNLRKGRGNDFEYFIVTKLEYCLYHARRMGGTTLGFPDVIATNNIDRTCLAIEAKSSEYDHVYVPIDQIYRCFRILEMFDIYDHKYAVLAFKFMSKRATKQTRELNKIIKAKRQELVDKKKIVSKKSIEYLTIRRLMDKRNVLANREIKVYYYIINNLRDTLIQGRYSSIKCTYEGKLSLIVTDLQTNVPVTNLEHMTFINKQVTLPHTWQL